MSSELTTTNRKSLGKVNCDIKAPNREEAVLPETPSLFAGR